MENARLKEKVCEKQQIDLLTAHAWFSGNKQLDDKVHPRSSELIVYKGISGLVLPGYGYCGLCRVCLHRHVPFSSYDDILEPLVLFSIAVDVGVFLVKTIKRVLFSRSSYEKQSSRHHYLLIFMVIAQFLCYFGLVVSASDTSQEICMTNH